MADRLETEKLIRSVLQSTKDRISLNQFERDYKLVTDDKIPYRKFGFSTLESYLKTIPHVVRLCYGPGGAPMLEAIPDATTQHIADMVSAQKRGKSSKRGVYKSPFLSRGNYTTRGSTSGSSYFRENTYNQNLPKSQYEVAPRFLKPNKPLLPTRVNHWDPTRANDNRWATPRAPIEDWDTTPVGQIKVEKSEPPPPPRINRNTENSEPPPPPRINRNIENSEPPPRINRNTENSEPPPPPPSRINRDSENSDQSWHRIRDSENSDQSRHRITVQHKEQIMRALLPSPAVNYQPKAASEALWSRYAQPVKPTTFPTPVEPLLPTPVQFPIQKPANESTKPPATFEKFKPNPVLPSQERKPLLSNSTLAIPRPTAPLSYKSMLETYARSNRLDVPVFNLLTMPGGIIATVKIDGRSFSSYPEENLSTDAAQEVAAKKAIEELGFATESEPTAVSFELEKMFDRIKKILHKFPRGVRSKQFPKIFKDEFKESLPSGWLDIVMEHNLVPFDKNQHDTLLFPKSESEESCNDSENDSEASNSPRIIDPTAVDQDYWEVLISYGTSTSRVYFRFVNSSDDFHQLGVEMDAFYENNKSTLGDVVVGHFYAAKFGNSWHRVEILSNTGKKVLCKFIDNGDYDYVDISDIQPLGENFLLLEPQANECKLHDLEEYENHPSALCNLHVIIGNTFVAEVKSRDPISLTLYDTSSGVPENVNLKLKASILEQDITPCLPDEGLVCDKPVMLTHILSNGYVYVQIQNECLTFVEDLLTEVRAICDALPAAESLQIGIARYLAKYADEVWYRARIESIDETKSEANVFFVDFGNTEKIPLRDIKDLLPVNEMLANLPFLAVQCKLKGVPPSSDLEWTPKAIEKLSDMALNESILLKVIIPHTSQTVAAVEIFKRSQDNQLIAINHTLEAEPELFRKSTSLENGNSTSLKNVNPTSLKNVNSKLVNLISNISEAPALPDIGGTYSVHVSLAANPRYFRVQPWDTFHILETLLVDMQKYYEKEPKIEKISSKSIEKWEYYAWKDKDDKFWYRAQVRSFDKTKSSFSLYYIDFGNVIVADIKEIYPLLDEFRTLPYQAISCRLAGVKPRFEDWRAEDAIYFQNLVENKEFVAVICQKDAPSDWLTLEVELFDTSDEKDISIGEVLIAEGRALPV